MCAPVTASFATNLQALPQVAGTSVELLEFKNLGIRSPSDDCVIKNVEGKKASFAILANIAKEFSGHIDKRAAQKALAIYAEVVEEARSNPGMHPTIDVLLRVAEGDLSFVSKIDGNFATS